MHASTPSPWPLRCLAVSLVGVVLGSGCRGEATPPLYTASTASPRPADDTDVGVVPGPVAEPHRNLWFASGPGRDAILARERQDHTTATALLDQLLASPKLSADDRGAAAWLRGLEDVAQKNYAAAAAHFATARLAPGLAPVDDRLRVLEAQAWLDAGNPIQALAAIGDLASKSGPLNAAARIITGDAKARTGDLEAAANLYQGFLEHHGSSARRHEVRAKWARLLVQHREPEALRQALQLYERLLQDVPLSDYATEASERIPALEQQLGVRKSLVETRQLDRAQSLARIREEQARGRYANVLKSVDDFLKLPGITDGDRCEALFLRGSAVFKQRKRAKSRPVFDQAATACRRARGHTDTLVKALYQAGRGRYAEAHYEAAARHFLAMAEEFSTHSYADDALILAGESWAEHGDHPRERAAYEKVLSDVPGGDMAGEARRRLIVLAFTQDRLADAHKLATDGLGGTKLDLRERAKLHYFRGRALQRQGQLDAAVDAWVEVIGTGPLTYASLQALSRLRDAGEAAFARGISVLERESSLAVELQLPADPAADRAVLLARLGLGEAAGEELAAAGVSGWPAISVLAQAGLYTESQRLVGNLGTAWRSQPPSGAVRGLWEIAHPLAFADIIHSDEARHQVPAFLTFAIMQTESVFNPGATSWAGARGLIQLMPATAKDLARQAGIADFSPEMLYQPAQNLNLGTRYLGNLVRRYGGDDAAVPLAIPSYNAGAGAVDRWLERRGTWDFDLFIESIPYDETRAYTQSVLERWWTYRWVHGSREQASEQRVPYVPLTIPKRA